MVTFFPTPLHDETFYGVVARFHVLAGHPNSRITLKELFGLDTVFPLSTLPSHLQRFTQHVCIMKVDQLIEEHTLVPYYRPFLEKATSNRLRSNMLGERGGAIKVSLGLPASRLGAADLLRYCVGCYWDDIQTYGIAYWHRSHQLPGMLVCPRHGTALLSLDSREIRASFSLVLPPPPRSEAERAESIFTTQENAALRCLATNSVALLESGLPSLCPTKIHDAYHEAATRLGMGHGITRVHPVKLHAAVHKQINAFPRCGPFPNLDLEHAVFDNWATRLLRAPRKNVHPLKHLILIQTLFGEFREFANALKATQATKALTVCRSARKQIRTNRTDLGCRQPPSLSTKQRIKFWALLCAGRPAAQVACSARLSLATTYRLIRSDPFHRRKWSEARFYRERAVRRVRAQRMLRRNREISKTELAHALGANYIWLMRHDRAWLSRHTPKRRKPTAQRQIDWDVRDTALAKHVLMAVTVIRQQQGRPRRVTVSAIGRQLGCLARLQKCLNKLPRTAQILHSACESSEDFRRRRIRWVANQLMKDGAVPKLWKIMRVAGIRTEYMASSRSYARKYTMRVSHTGLRFADVIHNTLYR
jgi:hypothetical protein